MKQSHVCCPDVNFSFQTATIIRKQQGSPVTLTMTIDIYRYILSNETLPSRKYASGTIKINSLSS